MKTIQFILLMLASLLLACGEDNSDGGIPVSFGNYYQIVDATTGKDWFVSHEGYDPAKVQLEGVSQNGEFLDLVLKHTVVEGRNVFGPVPGFITEKDTTTYHFKLAEDDTDTIFFDAKDCTRCKEGNYLRYESFTYYYNGEKMEYLDFRVDESEPVESYLIYQLARTNQTLTDSTYVMTFRKQSNGG